MDELVSEEDLQDEIALKVFEGDESALEDILRHYAPRIEMSLGKNYSGLLNRADIEDVLSIAIMKFWKHREQYDDKLGSIRAWLYRIADNSAKDLLRAGWHQARQLEKYTDKEFLENSLVIEQHTLQKTSIEQDTPESAKMVNAAQQVLNSLPDIQQKILQADAMIDGVADSAELGKRIGGYPSATIRQYRMRAKKAFREGMKKLGFEILEDKA
jgi:RNA polymerase sigma factor (sigma-70 family)